MTMRFLLNAALLAAFATANVDDAHPRRHHHTRSLGLSGFGGGVVRHRHGKAKAKAATLAKLGASVPLTRSNPAPVPVEAQGSVSESKPVSSHHLKHFRSGSTTTTRAPETLPVISKVAPVVHKEHEPALQQSEVEADVAIDDRPNAVPPAPDEVLPLARQRPSSDVPLAAVSTQQSVDAFTSRLAAEAAGPVIPTPQKEDQGPVASAKQELEDTQAADQAAIESLNQQVAQVQQAADQAVKQMKKRQEQADSSTHELTRELALTASAQMQVREKAQQVEANATRLARELNQEESDERALEAKRHARTKRMLNAKQKEIDGVQSALQLAKSDEKSFKTQVAKLRSQSTNLTNQDAVSEMKERKHADFDDRIQEQLKDTKSSEASVSVALEGVRKNVAQQGNVNEVLRGQIKKQKDSGLVEIVHLQDQVEASKKRADKAMSQIKGERQKDQKSNSEVISGLQEEVRIRNKNSATISALSAKESVADQELQHQRANGKTLVLTKNKLEGSIADQDKKIHQELARILSEQARIAKMHRDIEKFAKEHQDLQVGGQ